MNPATLHELIEEAHKAINAYEQAYMEFAVLRKACDDADDAVLAVQVAALRQTALALPEPLGTIAKLDDRFNARRLRELAADLVNIRYERAVAAVARVERRRAEDAQTSDAPAP